MNNKIIIILVVAILLVGGVFTLLSNRKTSPIRTVPINPIPAINPIAAIPTTSAPVIDTSDWKIYQNEQYGFAISYPDTLEPLEGNALFYFRPPQNKNPNFFNVCFAPTARAELYCEMEFYIFTGNIQALISGDTFLRFQKCDQEKTYVPKFDGKDGIHIETCGEEGIHRNAFAEYNGRIYLLVTEPRVGMEGKDEIFHKMIQSFKFLPVE